MAAAATMNGERCRATTVCVTGATGFVASSLVKCLLDKGYSVHATVRDPEDERKVRHLLDIRGAEERLKLFKADLLEEGSFDAAIGLCDGVFHVASPLGFVSDDPELTISFPLQFPQTAFTCDIVKREIVGAQNDMIKPAIKGTLNVLNACKKAKTVKRVLVTYSAAAVSINESEEQNRDESSWTDVDFLRTKKPPGWGYRVSKTLAEQAALQYGKEHELDVVTINPVVVVGSTITPSVPYSVQVALSPLTGDPKMIKDMKGLQISSGAFSLVHLDDVSSAHIFLMENPAAEGRYICSAINISVPHLAHYLSKRYPRYNVSAQFDDVPPILKVILSSKKLVDSGFSFKFGIDEILDDAVKYAKTKGFIRCTLPSNGLDLTTLGMWYIVTSN